MWISDDGRQWRPVTDPTDALRGPDLQQANDITASGPGIVAVGIDGTLTDVDAAVWTSP